MRESIQRDREEETMQRGKQYIRAVQLYYRKFNAYPPNVDALVKTNNIRFLRKKYIDPTTGKDEWKAIMFGQNKTPQAMGFFGQPLAAASCGARHRPQRRKHWHRRTGHWQGAQAPPRAVASSATAQAAPRIPEHGSRQPRADPPAPMPTATPPPEREPPERAPAQRLTGSAFGSSNNPTGSGQTFGGGGIIGFSPQSPKQSLMVYKKKNHYNEWEFLYSPHDGSADHGWRKYRRDRPARQRHHDAHRRPSNTEPGSPQRPPRPRPPTTPQQ